MRLRPITVCLLALFGIYTFRHEARDTVRDLATWLRELTPAELLVVVVLPLAIVRICTTDSGPRPPDVGGPGPRTP